jgi:hypothetical protein
MDILLMILAALLVLSGLDRYWSQHGQANPSRQVRRPAPRTALVHRAHRTAMGAQSLWRSHAARPSAAGEARWWYE